MDIDIASFTWVQPLLAFSVLSLLGYLYVSRKPRHRLPPGPTPLPFIGNVFDMPTRNLGESLRDLSVKYGDVVYLNILGQPMLILGSYKSAYELLEARSAISSDRLPSPLVEMTGAGWDFAFHGYNSLWRTRRRVFHQQFYPNALKTYRPTQLREVRRLLQKLLTKPENFVQDVKHYFGASIMNIIYGIEITNDDDKYLEMARKALTVFDDIAVPGRYLVENLPCLRFLPSWFPGARFKYRLAGWRNDILTMRNAPFEATMENMADGTARPCIITSVFERQTHREVEADEQFEEVLKDVCAVAYLTGADTTFSSVIAFFLAMTIYPEVQAKAQAELDAVVGSSRLPDFDDRPSLPYVNALVKECMRWHIVVTLGLPHRTVADQVYEGYFIPKGTVITSNIWALSRDPEEYPDPEEFRPERFLDTKAPARDPMAFVFGNGRRICAGRHFADSTLYIIIASVLHAFRISPPLDESGEPIRVEPRVTKDMFLSYPEPFECRIESRLGQTEEALVQVQSLLAY